MKVFRRLLGMVGPYQFPHGHIFPGGISPAPCPRAYIPPLVQAGPRPLSSGRPRRRHFAGSENRTEVKMSEGKKMTSSRRHHLKSMMLQIALSWLEQEATEIAAAKEIYMSEKCPDPDLSGDQAALMEICKKLHQAMDKIDEERYDATAKVEKTDKEIEELKLKVVDLAGVKKPALKKVRMSADAMLQALLGGRHKVTMDLRSNLKQVKKEVKEEASDAVGDWRKNIEDKADRKKMFETS